MIRRFAALVVACWLAISAGPALAHDGADDIVWVSLSGNQADGRATVRVDVAELAVCDRLEPLRLDGAAGGAGVGDWRCADHRLPPTWFAILDKRRQAMMVSRDASRSRNRFVDDLTVTRHCGPVVGDRPLLGREQA